MTEDSSREKTPVYIWVLASGLAALDGCRHHAVAVADGADF